MRFGRAVEGKEREGGGRWSEGDDGLRLKRGLENPILAERVCFAAKTIAGVKEEALSSNLKKN